MAFTSDSIDLLFKITASSDQARKEISDFSKVVERETGLIKSKTTNLFGDFAQGLGLSAERSASLSAALPVVGSAIAGIGAAAIGAGGALFGLAKEFSDYGSVIFDVTQKTGLSAEAISTLKLAADQSGSSIEAISGSVTKFSKLIGSATEGSKSAAASLTRLGLDPKAAINDLDGSLEKVFKRIFEAKNPIVATKLATEAFGKSGADLIPVIKQMDGDFDAFKETAKKLGVVLTDEDAKAADDFGDSLTELQSVAASVARTFAKEFTPEITKSMGVVEQLLIDNKGKFAEWGQFVGDIIRGISLPSAPPVPKEKSQFYKSVDEFNNALYDTARFVMDHSSTGGLAKNLSLENAQKSGAAARQLEEQQNRNVVRASSNEYSKITFGKGIDLGEVKAKAAKAKKDTADSFDKQFRAVAKEYEFDVSRTFGKTLNTGSLHSSGKAGDLGVHGKTNEQSFEVIAALLEKHFRVIDERVVGAFKGIRSTGPNIHAEQGAGVKPSLFLDASRYGGADNLAYLKKLDEDRLNKRTHTGDVKKIAEDRAKDEADAKEKKAKDEADANEKKVKAAIESDKRILESAKNTAEEEKAMLDQFLAVKILSVEDYAARVAKIDTDLLEKEKAQLENRLQLTILKPDERADVEAKRDAIAQAIKIKGIDAETAAIKRNSEALAKRKSFELDLSKEISDVNKEGNAAFFDRERARYRIEIEAGRNVLANLEGRASLEKEIAEAEKQETIDRLDREEAAYLKEAALLEESEKVKESIRNVYRLKRQQAEDEDEARRKQREDDENAKKATVLSSGTTAGGIADIIGGVVGGGVDPLNQIKTQADYMKAVHSDIAGSQKAAIGSMVQGLGQLAAQWLSTGKISAKAALQMVSGIATGLAIEAGLKALMEYAEGLAMLANPFTAALAPGHFAAAAAYGIAAAAAGAVGVGTGLAARAFGGGGAGGSSKSATAAFVQTTQGRTSSGSGGSYYSGASNDEKSNRLFEENRFRQQQNVTPTEVIHKHELTVPSGFIVKEISNNINNRGELHGLIIRTADA